MSPDTGMTTESVVSTALKASRLTHLPLKTDAKVSKNDGHNGTFMKRAVGVGAEVVTIGTTLPTTHHIAHIVIDQPAHGDEVMLYLISKIMIPLNA